ncbi:hypothetical protein [Rhodopseudomonas boonkerdii]|nr:hypothetical protein [Rhodopseudomonas boonkerdii]
MLPEEQSEGRTPAEAKTLSLGLLVWIFFAALVVLALFAYFRT